MPLPSLRSHKEAQASAPQAPESLLPSNTPLEFLIILSACRVFLGTEEPAKLEALLSQGPEWVLLLALSNRHGVMPLLCRSLGQEDRQPMTHGQWPSIDAEDIREE